MPIKASDQNGVIKLVVKSNGVSILDDPWKVAPENMFKLNPNSDKPNINKDQMIYIDQTAYGIMIVDSDKLVGEFQNKQYTMHQVSISPDNFLKAMFLQAVTFFIIEIFILVSKMV